MTKSRKLASYAAFACRRLPAKAPTLPKRRLILSAMLAAAPLSAQADPWTQVGAAARPSWVASSAERRLSLTQGLPAIEKAISTRVSGYFGTAGPGMSVGLILDDGLFYNRGFGYANLAKTSPPNEDTVFRWGSLSKVMTSMALLSMIDDPKYSNVISLNQQADQNKFVPELTYVCPLFNVNCARGQQHLNITIGELASHESGLANVISQPASYYGDEPVGWSTSWNCFVYHCDNYNWMYNFETSWVNFAPGFHQAYSGVGVELVGLIEQRLAMQPYPDFVKAHLFEPLGMHHSTMNPTTLADTAQAQMWRASVSTNSQWSFTPTTPSQALPGDKEPMLWPAGGLATTVRDMSYFVQMFLSGKAPNYNGSPLLSKNSFLRAEMPYNPGDLLLPYFEDCGLPTADGKDKHFNLYSECSGRNLGFGIGWWVEKDGQMSHSGDEPPVSGSQTIVNVNKKMGAVGVVATEGYSAEFLRPGIAHDELYRQCRTRRLVQRRGGGSGRVVMERPVAADRRSPRLVSLRQARLHRRPERVHAAVSQ